MSNLKNDLDVMVIGGGLIGLSIAQALKAHGMNIGIVEATEKLGGIHFEEQAPSTKGFKDNGLKFWPATGDARSALDYLQEHTGLGGALIEVENDPRTYISGQFKPFLGFGAEAPDFCQELNYFLAAHRLEFESHELFDQVGVLAQNLSSNTLLRSRVTKILNEEGAPTKVASVSVNGSKFLSAKYYVYCGPIYSLLGLCAEGLLSAKLRQRITKNQYWTALCLDIWHQGSVSDQYFMHLLNGTTQDEIGPSVGRFYTTEVSGDGTTLQHSKWLTFIDREMSEDAEVVGIALKKMKRQIKRAYPSALDQIYSEKIIVAPGAAGSDLDLPFRMGTNLYIGSHIGPGNLVESLLHAQKITAAIFEDWKGKSQGQDESFSLSEAADL